jgi:hypothetical protein
MTATLTAETTPGGNRVWTVDCRHGTTRCAVVDDEVVDREAARLVIASHYAYERCRCTRKLRRRYGVG